MKVVLLKILGLLLIIGSFLYNQYNYLRIIILMLGSIIFVIGALKNKNVLKFIIAIILTIISLYGVDYLLAKYCHRIPIISYKIESSDKVRTYNSFFYRVYDCNNKLIFDQNYHKNYACNIIVTEENINSLLSNIVNNFSKYHNKFINVNGKISGINGVTSITMQTFESSENSINGEVEFSDNIKLTIINNKELEKINELKIYDTINVIGRIDRIEEKDQVKQIIMQDAKIISRSDFTKFKINVIENKKCEVDLKKISLTDEYAFYTHCLDAMYVKFDDNSSIYELGYVLTDKRLTLDMIIKGIEKEETEINELYKLDEFNIIKCKNSNNVILSKNLDLNSKYCNNFLNTDQEDVFEGV